MAIGVIPGNLYVGRPPTNVKNADVSEVYENLELQGHVDEENVNAQPLNES